MVVMVTGSLGTIGRPTVRGLRNRGHHVWGLDQVHSGDSQYIRADISDRFQVRRAFETAEPEVVLHLAAEFGRVNGELYSDQLWTTNMVGTRNVLDEAAERGVRVVFASSSEVYGDGFDTALEEDLLDEYPPHLTNDYAISKYANELQIRAHSERYGTDVQVLRFFNAYGPGESYTPFRSVVALFCWSALMNKPFNVYQGYHRTFMHIHDFVPTLVRAVERPRQPDWPFAINIGGRDYRSVEELAEIVLVETGAPKHLINLLEREEHNVVDKFPVIFHAVGLLGHDPQIKLEQGVPGTVDWLRKELGR